MECDYCDLSAEFLLTARDDQEYVCAAHVGDSIRTLRVASSSISILLMED